jgi:hypothetical protein
MSNNTQLTLFQVCAIIEFINNNNKVYVNKNININNFDVMSMQIVKNNNEKNTNKLVIRRSTEYKSRNQPLKKGGGNRTPL